MVKKGKKSRKKAKVKSFQKSIPVMAKRGGKAKTVLKKVGSRGGLGKAQSIFKRAAGGVGGGVIAEDVIAMVSPGPIATIGGYGGAYLGGGATGVIAKLGFDVLTGRATWLQGIFPSGNGGGNGGESL